jgi:hypothetical protein
MMKVTVQHVDGLRFLATVGRHMVVVDPASEDRGGGSLTSLDQTGTKENMEHVEPLEESVRVKARSALDAMLAVR